MRYALERMASELREAGYDPTAAGIAPVVVAEPTRVEFLRDMNGNGVIDPTRERVTYVLRAGESILRRDAGGGAQPGEDPLVAAPSTGSASIAGSPLSTGRPSPQLIVYV